MDSRGPSSPSLLQKSCSKSDHGRPAASRSRSSSFAATVAAVIFLRNNGARKTKKATATAKKKLNCGCRLPPLPIKCPLHRFGSWPFSMLAKSASVCGEKKKEVVLPVTTSGISSVYANYLRRSQKKQPSRFFFEHQARVASEASGAGLK